MTTEAALDCAVPTEAAARADFTSIIRYAQCWEDADILLDALNVQKGETCLSIASAGDNSLSLLTRYPAKVIAVDLNPAQLACVALRVAAYKTLSHDGLLKLLGSLSASGSERLQLYAECSSHLPPEYAAFWNQRPRFIRAGFASVGKFESYFALFRRWVLPWVHSRRKIRALLERRAPEIRCQFYEKQWNTWRWRMIFALFFSRTIMGWLGRDPEFFKYVEGPVSDRILQRARHALAELDPSANPYLRWILTGQHTPTVLPHALRAENFNAIRENLDRFEYRRCSIEQALDQLPVHSIDRFNLSDIFEYMSDDNYRRLLARLVRHGRPGGRLAYWNMLVPRARPEIFAASLRPLADLAAQLHDADKAFFYSNFIVEEFL